MPRLPVSLLRFAFATPLLLVSSAFAATNITGTITNATTGKPSAGDTVTLIRLAQGMQESTHTTTDAKGNYSLVVPDEGIHLVRATHDKANYFKPAPPGTTSVDIDVYAVAARVTGVVLQADVMRLQTEPDGKSLRIVQHFFLKNDSTPPKTQFSDATFDFTLPEGAVIEGAAAQGPGGMTVQSQPVPLTQKNHYTFNFPIRPAGQTQFQVSYKVPYTGTLQLSPSTALASENMIVMMPKAMHFDTSASVSSVPEEASAQTYVARNVPAGKAITFNVGGEGQLPRETTTASQEDQGNSGPVGTPATGADPNANPGSLTVDKRPGGGLGTPIDTPDPLSKYKWWIIAGIGLALAAAAGFFLSRPAGAPATPAVAPPTPPATPHSPHATLQVLRDELFSLESERLTGRISPDEYSRLRDALEIVLQHALHRDSAKPAGSA